MTKTRMASLALAAALLGGAVGGVAHAQGTDSGADAKDQAAAAAMKITLSQAIAAAEQQGGGHAVSADVSDHAGAPQVEVEVADQQGVKTVLVDGITGKVLPMAADGDSETND